MTEPKFTEGPWEVSMRGIGRIETPNRRGFNDGNYRIADAYFSTAGLANTPSKDEALANARLIAAGPDLYAVNTDLCAILDMFCDESGIIDDPHGLVNELEKQGLHERVTAALAKARGEAS